MPQTPIDTLIVGQGLAGSLLAWMLIRAGRQVCVIDDGHKSSSSTVAAGLVNPLAGMRFNRRPEMDDWLMASDACYDTLAAQFGRPFFHALPMLRLFRSTDQIRFHTRRLDDPASRGLLEAAFKPADCPEPSATPYGGFIQRRTGFVDMSQLLACIRAWLRDNGALLELDLGHKQIEVTQDHVAAVGIKAQGLVFCDGARLLSNPWFGKLPLAPDKGEILNLQVDGWRPRHIINGAHWILPLPNGELRLGATHEHHLLDNEPTRAGAQELLDGLDAMLRSSLESRVLQHRAGIRPATRDRYPLLGHHPEHPRLWVFNGFGARGALTIPWYAGRFSAHLTRGMPLPPEADIRRFL